MNTTTNRIKSLKRPKTGISINNNIVNGLNSKKSTNNFNNNNFNFNTRSNQKIYK